MANRRSSVALSNPLPTAIRSPFGNSSHNPLPMPLVGDAGPVTTSTGTILPAPLVEARP